MTPQELLTNLQTMQARSNDPSLVLTAIGDLMMRSTDMNFRAQGRPDGWKDVTAATRKRKTQAGKSKILTWIGDLADSIDLKVVGRRVVMGSICRYARIHQKGGIIPRKAKDRTIRLRTDASGNLLRQGSGRLGNLAVFATKGHKRAVERAFTQGAYDIPMPARPFLLFQPGEPENYAAMVLDYILTGRIQEGA